MKRYDKDEDGKLRYAEYIEVLAPVAEEYF